jgi:hypothetical protein
MPAPAWSPLTPVPEPAADLADDARSPADDSPPTTVAAADDAWRGPEEFIAPPPQAVAGTAVTGPAGEQPAAAPGEEELMWLGDEFEEADLEVAAQGWRSPDTAPKPAGATPTLELSDAELAQLAEDEGWDPDEVEAIRRLLGRPSDAPPELPVQPAVDIRRPETRLDAQPEGPRPTDRPPTPPAGPTSAEPSGPETSSPPQGTGIVDDPDWLEDRGGTAAEAYRRLRKLFPG